MAHTARIAELAGGLVSNITGTSRDDQAFRRMKDEAVKGLRDTSNARTNQFAVREALLGLVEKSSVLNRESLADALQSRLDELPPQARWLPESLALLLSLSDRPVEKTDLAALDGLQRVASDPTELTWGEIIADDPLTEDGIWDDVDRGYHSSGDDATVDGEDDSELTTSTQTSFDEEDFAELARRHVVQPDRSLLDDVRASEDAMLAARTHESSADVSELTIIRECLAMLRGLPTYLFHLDVETGTVTPKAQCNLNTVEAATVRGAVTRCAATASSVNSLHHWTTLELQPSFLQSIQACVHQHLRVLGSQLDQLEKHYVQPSADCVVSIIDICEKAEAWAAPLVRLAEVFNASVNARAVESPFILLDMLYHEACLAQMAGDRHLFAVLASALCNGLRPYLQSIKAWMATGTLPSRKAHIFFVTELDADCELGEFWHKRYVLRTLPDGDPCAPICMQSFVQTAFATGKSKAFLRLLGTSEDVESHHCTEPETQLDFDAIERYLHDNPLQPFDELMAERLDSMLAVTDVQDTQTVRDKLLTDAGILPAVNAIDNVFFARDGSAFQVFAETLFDLICRRPRAWQEQFVTTELAQATLGAVSGVDAHCLRVCIADADDVSQVRSTMRRLGDLKMDYSLAWPMQNITRSKSLPTHAAAFGFLLQVAYTGHILQKQVFDLRELNSTCAELPQASWLALRLRASFLWFASLVNDHIVITASGLHQSMVKQLGAADGIDSMTIIWADYEKHLQSSLLLTSGLSPIRDAITSVLEMGERFAAALPLASIDVGSSDHTATMIDEFERAVSFVCSSLRGTSRAGGDATFETLAERLQWRGG